MVDLIILDTVNPKAVRFTWKFISWNFHIIKNDAGLRKFLNNRLKNMASFWLSSSPYQIPDVCILVRICIQYMNL